MTIDPLVPGTNRLPAPQRPAATPPASAPAAPATARPAGDRAQVSLDNPFEAEVDPADFAALQAALEGTRAPEDDGSTWGDWQAPHKPEFNFHHQAVGGQLWAKDANGDVVWADNGKRVAAGQVDLMPEGQRNAYFQLAGVPPIPRNPAAAGAFHEPKPGPGVQHGGHWSYTEDLFGYGSSRLGGDGENPVDVGGDSGLGVPMPVAYNPKQDKARFDWSTHECVESSFCRVERWANDLVQFKHMDPNEAFYASIQRLRQDFKDTERDWSESGFAEVPLPKR
jgi:hypothetical protein